MATQDKLVNLQDLKAAYDTQYNIIAAKYSATGRYNVGDYCIYNGKLYRCKKEITVDTEWNESTYWAQCTTAGQIQTVLEEDIAPAWEANHAYQAGDYVSYNRYIYRMSVQPVTPDAIWTESHWTRVNVANDLAARIVDEATIRENENNDLKSVIGNGFTFSSVYTDDLNSAPLGWIRYSASCTNKPSTVAGFMVTLVRNSTTKKQIAIDDTADQPTMYIRALSGSTWSTWKQEVVSVNGKTGVVMLDPSDIGSPTNAEFTPVRDKTNLIYQDSPNLFDKDSDGIIEGKYIRTDGTLATLSGWNVSDYIPVSGLTSIVGSVFKADGSYFTYCLLNYMHSYNSSKEHIAKIWDQTNTNGVYTVGENVAYIRFCWQPDNETSDGKQIMIEKGSARSTKYEPYDVETHLQESAYPTFFEVAEMIRSGAENDVNISCWGDSLTYGTNETESYPHVGSVTYPSLLKTLTGVEVANLGMPGANSMDISGLQGGMPVYLEPFSLPADTSVVDVTLMDANSESSYIGLLHWGKPNPEFNMGLTWKIEDIPVSLSYSDGTMHVKRLEAGSSAKQFTRPVKITPVHEYAVDQIQIFWVGTNDAPTTQAFAERTVRIIQNMVKYYGGGRYLVLGLTKKEYANATNALLAQTFGNHYVDVKTYLIKYGLSDSSITPTAQDETDISNDVVPISLRSDYVHFNDYGYTAVGNCVYQHGKMLGYWE